MAALVTLLAAGLLAAPAWGATYYVDDTGGNDSRTTTEAQNPATPWATIAKCAATLVAGDTCSVRAGAYAGATTFTNNGTAGNPITYAAYSGERPVLTGGLRLTARDYLTLEGFECTGTNACINTPDDESTPSTHIVIRNIYAHDMQNQPAQGGDNTAAIRLDACQDCTIEDFYCENVANHQGGSLNYRGQNATCILSYNAWGTTIQRMICKNTGTCIFLKEAPEQPGPHATISGVYCENAQICVRASVAGQWDAQTAPSTGSPWRDVSFTDSICVDLDNYCFAENAGDSEYDQELPPPSGLVLANLTVINAKDIATVAGGWSSIRVYNNCYVSGNVNLNAYALRTLTVGDYNLFATGRDRGQIDGVAYTSLAAIQAGTAHEDHGQVVADFGFVAGTYRIDSDSPAWNAGKSDGTVTGATVHACAPADHSTVVGLAPRAPTVP